MKGKTQGLLGSCGLSFFVLHSTESILLKIWKIIALVFVFISRYVFFILINFPPLYISAISFSGNQVATPKLVNNMSSGEWFSFDFCP